MINVFIIIIMKKKKIKRSKDQDWVPYNTFILIEQTDQ